MGEEDGGRRVLCQPPSLTPSLTRAATSLLALRATAQTLVQPENRTTPQMSQWDK